MAIGFHFLFFHIMFSWCYEYVRCELMDAVGWHADSRAFAFNEYQMIGYWGKNQNGYLKIQCSRKERKKSVANAYN